VPNVLRYGTPAFEKDDARLGGATDTVVTPGETMPKDRGMADAATPSTVVDEVAEPINNTLSKPNQAVRSSTTLAPTSSAPRKASFSAGGHEKSTRTASSSVAELQRSEVQQDSVLNTQSSNVLDMRRALKDMMQPEQITQGDTQMRSQMKPPPPIPTESASTPSTSTSKDTTTAARTALAKPILSPTKARHLDHEKARLRRAALDRVKKGGGKVKKADVVLCQCGHDEEEDGMVQCTYCSTWQHLQCYGYTDANDLRLPDKHTCYLCLLDGDEQLIKEKLQDLALKRRAMGFALQNGLTTQADLARDMGTLQIRPWKAALVKLKLLQVWKSGSLHLSSNISRHKVMLSQPRVRRAAATEQPASHSSYLHQKDPTARRCCRTCSTLSSTSAIMYAYRQHQTEAHADDVTVSTSSKSRNAALYPYPTLAGISID